MLEINFLHINFCEDLTFAMMIKKFHTCIGEGPEEAKNMDFGGILRLKPLYCQ